ncbi:hypothetical protein KGY79_00160 [Candidatus Bipolaricaulota bacterium]|nr:hypothetical protein [Candidatus Bipolaricaulota bacterium]
MSQKCVYGGKRKGERECPALGGMICSRCCGEHRGVEINCPPDCRYFKKHEEFQQSKHAESYRQTWAEENQDLLEEENRKLIEAIGVLETLIYYRYRDDTRLTDKKVIDGLKGLENKFKTIELPGSTSEFTEFAHEELKPLLEKGRFSRELLKNAASRLITIAEDYSDDSRQLVQGIVGRIKEDYDLPGDESGDRTEKIESLITTPGQINQGQSGPNR